jgi:hypothetical protein
MPAGRRRYKTAGRSPAIPSHPFEQGRNALSHSDAHGRQGVAPLDALQLPRSG